MQWCARRAGGDGVHLRRLPQQGLRRAEDVHFWRFLQDADFWGILPWNGAPFNGALYIVVHHLMVRYI